MIENSQNKAVTDGDKPEQVEQEQPTVINEIEYHFPGGGEYFPMTVKASSLDKAQEIYLKKRVPYIK